MASARQNITVGLFVIVGIALLGVLIVWFGEEPDWLREWTGKATWRLHISFDDLSDVEAGTEVRMAIGRVGQVADVRFWDPERPGIGVDVVAEIRLDVSVPSNTLAVVQPSSMLSRSYVLLRFPLDTTEPPVPKDGSGRIRGEVAGVLDSVVPPGTLIAIDKAVVAITNLAEALTPVAHHLDDLIEPRTVERVDAPAMGQEAIAANLATAVERLDTLLKHFNTVVGDPQTQSQLREAVANLHQISTDGRLATEQFLELSKEARDSLARARQVIDNADDLLANADENFARLIRETIQVMQGLGEAVSGLEHAATALAEGEGTTARLINDDRLYESMVLTFNRITELAAEMQKLVLEIREKGLKTRL